MTSLEALDRFARFGSDLCRGNLCAAIDPAHECRDLNLAIAALTESRPRTVAAADGVSLQTARARWRESRPSITGLHQREIRILCWDPDTALDPQFIQAVAGHPAFRRKRVWIEGLAIAYFGAWRTMPAPDLIENVLRAATAPPGSQRGWLGRCGSQAADVFSATADMFFARNALDRGISVVEELKNWGLEDNTQFRQTVVEAAIGEWLRCYLEPLEGLAQGPGIRELKTLLDGLLPMASVTSPKYYDAVGRLILSTGLSAGPLHELLKTWILNSGRLGDPRHRANLPKWNKVATEAVSRFKSWLAKGDLLFFFEFVIPDRQDPHGRKPFWLQYIDQVEDSMVLLCARDRDRLPAGSDQFRFGTVTDAGDVSAFLMRFRTMRGEVIVVEFSRPGNSIYIYQAVYFERHVGDMRTGKFAISGEHGLKHLHRATGQQERGQQGRFAHHAGWQSDVRAFLAGLGIRPR